MGGKVSLAYYDCATFRLNQPTTYGANYTHHPQTGGSHNTINVNCDFCDDAELDMEEEREQCGPFYIFLSTLSRWTGRSVTYNFLPPSVGSEVLVNNRSVRVPARLAHLHSRHIDIRTDFISTEQLAGFESRLAVGSFFLENSQVAIMSSVTRDATSIKAWFDPFLFALDAEFWMPIALLFCVILGVVKFRQQMLRMPVSRQMALGELSWKLIMSLFNQSLTCQVTPARYINILLVLNWSMACGFFLMLFSGELTSSTISSPSLTIETMQQLASLMQARGSSFVTIFNMLDPSIDEWVLKSNSLHPAYGQVLGSCDRPLGTMDPTVLTFTIVEMLTKMEQGISVVVLVRQLWLDIIRAINSVVHLSNKLHFSAVPQVVTLEGMFFRADLPTSLRKAINRVGIQLMESGLWRESLRRVTRLGIEGGREGLKFMTDMVEENRQKLAPGTARDLYDTAREDYDANQRMIYGRSGLIAAAGLLAALVAGFVERVLSALSRSRVQRY